MQMVSLEDHSFEMSNPKDTICMKCQKPLGVGVGGGGVKFFMLAEIFTPHTQH